MKTNLGVVCLSTIFLFFITSFIYPQTNKIDNQNSNQTSINQNGQNTTSKTNPWLKNYSDENATSKEITEFNSTELFFKSFLILVVFIAILYLLFRWIQKKKLESINQSSDDIIRVLKTSSISPNKTVQIVEIGKRIYILGLGDQIIAVLNTIDDIKEIEELKTLCLNEPQTKPSNNFSQVFSNYFGGNKKENVVKLNNGKTLNENPFHFFNSQMDRLKDLKNKF